jgi:hypothetical protein
MNSPKWYESKNHARFEPICSASDDTPRGFSSDWYEKWYESKNHARLEPTGIENYSRRLST